MVAWEIWKERCVGIYEGKLPNLANIVGRCVKHFAEMEKVKEKVSLDKCYGIADSGVMGQNARNGAKADRDRSFSLHPCESNIGTEQMLHGLGLLRMLGLVW